MAKVIGFDETSENMVAYATIVNGIQWKAPPMQTKEKCWGDRGWLENLVYKK